MAPDQTRKIAFGYISKLAVKRVENTIRREERGVFLMNSEVFEYVLELIKEKMEKKRELQ